MPLTALLLLLYNTGARVHELVDLKTGPLRLQTPFQARLLGKGQTYIITVHDEPAAQIGPVQSPARKLTEEWRRRVKSRDIRLNRPGRKRLTLSQLVQEGRK